MSFTGNVMGAHGLTQVERTGHAARREWSREKVGKDVFRVGN